MLLGLETFSFHLAFSAGEMDIPAYIERCASLGLDGVQLNMGHLGPFLRADSGRVRQVREMAAARGLFVEVDSRGTDPAHLANMLRLCRDLGADVLRTYVSCGGDIAQELAQAPDHLRAVVPMCRDLGIRIALENHEYETSQDILKVVRRVGSEWVGAHVDTGNSMMVWEEPVAAVRAMAPFAVSTHFKDHVVVVENGHPLVVGIALGRGSIDCRECFCILAEDSHLDRLVIEVCYGYSAPFRCSQTRGAGGRLGEGAFRVAKEPLDPSWVVSHTEGASSETLRQLIAWQDESVIHSVDYVKRLNAEMG
ncbi:MAG: sugar phosphate isomerase/epimerase [Armatimonadetes bacterium CG_4_8_14_3_um_filter_58_9]|nr:MAG: sugar phosphate isomerase/epimerase [Armatimonadetes bacterium CG_4_8_14_3_um_filter_58_9]PJB62936.1 MAG: sugar phosphate isomerase/epimerase [Armatimonadetes bacterium CG_4_9_14_3_um_filter_58_7]